MWRRSSQVKARYRSWIPGIVFWVFFLVCIGLYRRYPWLDFAWNAAWMLLLTVIASSSVIATFRNRDAAGGYVGYRGVPRWVVRLFGGDCD
jgi:hypothetical protein